MSGSISFWHRLANTGRLLFESTNVIIADFSDTLVRKEGFEHFEAFFKVLGGKILDKQSNIVFSHTRTGRVALVDVGAHGERLGPRKRRRRGAKGSGLPNSSDEDKGKGAHDDSNTNNRLCGKAF
eukprot:scaffold7485_cov176-Amphora_coffeaeformis.AAC.4